MKKSVIIILVILSIVFLTVTVGGFLILKNIFNRSKPVEGIDGYDTYISKNIGASFKYPSNWKIEYNPGNKNFAQIWFQGPGTNKTPYRTKFSVARWTLKNTEKKLNGKEIKDLADLRKEETKQNPDDVNYKLHFDEEAQFGGEKAFWFRYSSDDPLAIKAYGDRMNKALAHTVWEEIVTQKGNNFYFIFWTFQGDEKYYDDYYEAFLKTKESFKFIE